MRVMSEPVVAEGIEDAVAEGVVIASAIVSPANYGAACARLDPGDFYAPWWAKVWRALADAPNDPTRSQQRLLLAVKASGRYEAEIRGLLDQAATDETELNEMVERVAAAKARRERAQTLATEYESLTGHPMGWEPATAANGTAEPTAVTATNGADPGPAEVGRRVGNEEGEGERTTWEPVALGPIVEALEAGDIARPMPTVGQRDDGVCLFYPGRINGINGESGNGKSWVALHVATQELEAGNHVLFVDFEERADSILRRLLDLGAKPDAILARFHYLAPDKPFGLIAAGVVVRLIQDKRPTLAVIDSTGEAMAVQGTKQNDDAEVATWFRTVPRLMAVQGPAVLATDHVTKDAETRGLHAIGSQRKRAAISGAAYMLDVTREFGKGVAGAGRLICAKDRNGTHLRGRIAAHFHIDATTLALKAWLAAPPKLEADQTFRPTVLMERVSRALEELPAGSGLTKNAIEEAVRGKAMAKRLALELLVAEGYVTTERQGQYLSHASHRPYREAKDGEEEEPRPIRLDEDPLERWEDR